MSTLTNLWHDIDALARLATSGRAAEGRHDDGRPVRIPPPWSEWSPSREHRRYAIHAVESPARVVNGDYHDCFFVARDTLALVMADVSGKGVPAALLMSFVRSMVRNVSACSDSPGDTLTRVNRMLYDAGLGPMFVTIFLGWYQIRSGGLRYANAGHPQPFRIDRIGRVAPLGETTGPILGILDVERYGDRQERLGTGDRLLLFTDGVTEARSPDGEFFGADRLVEFLSAHAHEPVGGLCEGVSRVIRAFQGPRLQDDATLLGLERKR